MPQDKLLDFYNSISKNPNITGIPKDYETFKNALSDENNSKKFFDAISQNKNIKGLPSDYDTFADALGLKKKGNTAVPSENGGTPGAGEAQYTKENKQILLPTDEGAFRVATEEEGALIAPSPGLGGGGIPEEQKQKLPKLPDFKVQFPDLAGKQDVLKTPTTGELEVQAQKEIPEYQKKMGEFYGWIKENADAYDSPEAKKQFFDELDNSALSGEEREEAYRTLIKQQEAKRIAEQQNQEMENVRLMPGGQQMDEVQAFQKISERNKTLGLQKLNSSQRKLYELNGQIAELESNPNKTRQDQLKIAELESQRQQIDPSYKQLYNVRTGGVIGTEQEKQEAKAYEGEVNRKAQEYAKKLTYAEQLNKVFQNNANRYKYWQNKYKSGIPVSDVVSLRKKADDLEKRGYVEQANELRKAADNTKIIPIWEVLNNPYFEKTATGLEAREISNNYIESKRDFDAINQAYLLNKNITVDKDAGYQAKLFLDKIVEGFIPEVLTRSGVVENPDLSNRAYIDAFVKVANDESIPLTKEQTKAYEKTFGESVNEGVAGLASIIFKLAIARGGVNIFSEITGLANIINKLRAGSKLQKLAAGLLDLSLEEATTKAAGLGTGAGIGFGLSNKIMSNSRLKFKGKIGAIIQPFFDKVVAGSIGGTTGMELAAITETTIKGLMEDKDWQAMVEEEFGTLSKAGKRIASELIVNGLFGIAHTKKKDYTIDPKKLRTLADELNQKGMSAEAQEVIGKAYQIEKINAIEADREIAEKGLATGKVVDMSRVVYPKGTVRRERPAEMKPEDMTIAGGGGVKPEEVTPGVEAPKIEVAFEEPGAKTEFEEVKPAEEALKEEEDIIKKIELEELSEKLEESIGTRVDYEGIEGRLDKDAEGNFVVMADDGLEYIIEGGLSGKTPAELGVKKAAERPVIEIQEQQTEEIPDSEILYDFESGKLSLYGKDYTYEGVETDTKGNTTAVKVKDSKGNTKYIRNQNAINEIEIQKILAEDQNSGKYTVDELTKIAQDNDITSETKVAEPISTEITGVQQEKPSEAVEAAPEEKPKKSGLEYDEQGNLKKWSASDLSTKIAEDVFEAISILKPEYAEVMNEAKEVVKKIKELRKKSGNSLKVPAEVVPFPYKLYSELFTSRSESRFERVEPSLQKIKEQIQKGKEFIDKAPSEKELESMRAEKEKESAKAEEKAKADREKIDQAFAEQAKKKQEEAKKREEDTQKAFDQIKPEDTIIGKEKDLQGKEKRIVGFFTKSEFLKKAKQRLDEKSISIDVVTRKDRQGRYKVTLKNQKGEIIQQSFVTPPQGESLKADQIKERASKTLMEDWYMSNIESMVERSVSPEGTIYEKAIRQQKISPLDVEKIIKESGIDESKVATSLKNIIDDYKKHLESKGIEYEKAKEEKPKETEVEKEEGPVTEKDVNEQIKEFGVPEEDVEATHSVLNKIFEGLKNAGLATVNTVGEWVGIGKGKKEKAALKQSTYYGESGIVKKPSFDNKKADKAIKSGRIKIATAKESLGELFFSITRPDDLFVGDLFYNGKKIGSFDGGVFYPLNGGEKGKMWASVSQGSASGFANQANRSLLKNNNIKLPSGFEGETLTYKKGNNKNEWIAVNKKGQEFSFTLPENPKPGVVVLTKGDSLKHKTSLSGKVGFVKTLLEYANGKEGYDGLINAIKSIYSIGNTKNAEKIIQLFDNYLKGGRMADGQTMDEAKTSYDNFRSALIKNANPIITQMLRDMGYDGPIYFDATQLKKGIYKATGKGVDALFKDLGQEDFLKNVKSDDAYAALKIKSPVMWEKDTSHPSYPFVIKTVDGSEVGLDIFNKTFSTSGENIGDAANSGRTISEAAPQVTTTLPKYKLNTKIDIDHPTNTDLSDALGKYESVKRTQALKQKDNAQYRINSGKNIIEALKNFDGSKKATVAFTHEIMHPTVVSIIDGAKENNEVGTKQTKTIVDEFNKANPGSKLTVEQLIEANEAFKNGQTSKQYRDVQEFIAEAWERYHYEGAKGFSVEFQKILDHITEAFRAVYKALKGEELTPELRKLFDDILGKEEVQKMDSEKATEKEVEGVAKLYDKPELESPVYRVVINGKERFIQKIYDYNTPSLSGWIEVVKDKDGAWTSVKKGRNAYDPDEYTKAEMIERLKGQESKEEAPKEEGPKEEAPKVQAKEKTTIEFPEKIEATEVKPYTELEQNYYRPDQQLNFKQGTYEAVRIIAHPDVITAISIGKKLSNLDGKTKVSKQERKFAENIAKKLGFVFDDGTGNPLALSKAVKELAKQNRNESNEVFVVIGNEVKPEAPKAEKPAEKPAEPLRDVESTAKALEEKIKGKTIGELRSIIPLSSDYDITNAKEISEAYHADKAAGIETKLTQAVEELLGEKPAEAPKEAPKTEVKEPEYVPKDKKLFTKFTKLDLKQIEMEKRKAAGRKNAADDAAEKMNELKNELTPEQKLIQDNWDLITKELKEKGILKTDC